VHRLQAGSFRAGVLQELNPCWVLSLLICAVKKLEHAVGANGRSGTSAAAGI
jgi:hypothetical protein